MVHTEDLCSQSVPLEQNVTLPVHLHVRRKRDLKIEVFRHFPRTANVKKSRDQSCGLRFTFVREDHALEVSDLPQVFLQPKTSQSHV